MSTINWVLNTSGAPDDTWLLCAKYCIFIMNHTALKSLNWRTPLEVLTGQTPDVSLIKNCGLHFYDPVYFSKVPKPVKCIGHGDSSEEKGYFVGFGEGVGHSLTFTILTDKTRKIIYRSRIRPTSIDPNKRIEPAPEV